MRAVMVAPAIMWTISNERLITSTLHVVQPDLSNSRTILVVDHLPYVPKQSQQLAMLIFWAIISFALFVFVSYRVTCSVIYYFTMLRNGYV